MTLPHVPSTNDVLSAKQALFRASAAKLPVELIDDIIDFAEYWPCVSVSTQHQFVAHGTLHGRRRMGEPNQQDVLVLRSAPVGYASKDLNDSRYSLPLEQFSNTFRERQKFPLPDLSDCDVTNDVLSAWTADSQTRGKNLCRRIVFTIKSRDQGWGGEPENRGTFHGSFTWFDVGKEKVVAVAKPSTPGKFDRVDPNQLGPLPETIFKCELGSSSTSEQRPKVLTLPIIPALESQPESERQEYEHPYLPQDTALQKNRTATRELKENIIVWSSDDNSSAEDPEAAELLESQGRGRATANGKFVRELQAGDVVTVWARARFPGWTNTVESVKMDVYWTV